MKLWIALPLVLLVSAPAWAQQPPLQPQYVPITIDEKSYKEITGWLLEQPTKFGAPMLQWLETQERAAVALANKPKEPPKVPPEPPKKPD